MESDAFAIRTALFVVIASVLAALSWSVFRENRFEYHPYIVITDESVSGLALQARVYYKGVEVGTVQEIFFADNDFNHVQILIHVDQSIPIARNTYAQLALRGITGEYDLRLDNDGALGERLPTGELDPGVIPMRSEYIAQLGESIEAALADLGEISDRVSELLSDDNQSKISRMLTNVGDAAEQIGSLEQRLAPTLDELPQTLQQIERTLHEYQQLANSLGQRTASVEQTLARIGAASDTVEALAGRLQGSTLDNAEQSLVAIDQASQELNRLLEDLRHDPQRLLFGTPPVALGPGEQELQP